MAENISSPEEPRFTRKQVVDAFKVFPERGFKNPADLPVNDQDVISANALLQVWANQRQSELRRTKPREANLQFSLERTTVYVDAGFTDHDYLVEVTNDWLAQDLDVAKGAGLTELAVKIQSKIDEINSKLD